jgi:hypothetical protein
MDELTKYQFGKKTLNHYFCPVCGVAVFSNNDGDGRYMVNLNTVEGVDLDAVEKIKFDGASL